MSPVTLSPDFATTFTLILDNLCRTAAHRLAAKRSFTPLLLLLVARLHRLATRFVSLAIRAAAGPIQPRKTAAPRTSVPRPEEPAQKLPRGVGWLIKLLPREASCFGGQLQHLMAQPEFAAFLDAAPQAGRLLRPLCKMLAVPPPANLVPPPKPNRPPPQAAAPAQNPFPLPVPAAPGPAPDTQLAWIAIGPPWTRS